MPSYGDVPFDLIEEGKEKLLLLESLEDRREKIRDLLAGEGYHVLVPAGEEAALENSGFRSVPSSWPGSVPARRVPGPPPSWTTSGVFPRESGEDSSLFSSAKPFPPWIPWPLSGRA